MYTKIFCYSLVLDFVDILVRCTFLLNVTNIRQNLIFRGISKCDNHCRLDILLVTF